MKVILKKIFPPTVYAVKVGGVQYCLDSIDYGQNILQNIFVFQRRKSVKQI